MLHYYAIVKIMTIHLKKLSAKAKQTAESNFCIFSVCYRPEINAVN